MLESNPQCLVSGMWNAENERNKQGCKYHKYNKEVSLL